MANSHSPPRSTAILYQNLEKTVTLFDIPTSISLAAQGGQSMINNGGMIYSAAPPEAPYPSTEPKSDKAKANVMRIMGSAGMKSVRFPATLLRHALGEIKTNHYGHWCLPRQIPSLNTPTRRGVKKRKLNDIKVKECAMETMVEPNIQIPTFDGHYRRDDIGNPYTLCKNNKKHFPDVEAIARRLVHNPYSEPLTLSIGSAVQTYSIPPKTAFYLTNIDKSSMSDFSAVTRSSLSTPTASAGPGQFDFVLLDPPWDNSSVKRSAQYNTLRHGQDPLQVLHESLGKHIAPGALVACWITNKERARECALAAFDFWGVDLVEEWAWLKTTVDGVPVTDLEGLWRKPYEILCLGKQVDFSIKSDDEPTALQRDVVKKVIVAVPDLHSRKPCLKELLEQLIPTPAEYRALEIFARNLTAGWWSWGNEAIKYNWEGYWSRHE